MTINDKIKQILIDRNFTPSYFADEIGVQRSSISHILSGRNRPSFDIIQKIIRRFPDLGYEWIMEEEPAVVSSPPASPFGTGYNPAVGRPGGNRPSADLTTNRYAQPSSAASSPYVPQVTTAPVRPQRSEIPPVALPTLPEPDPATPSETAANPVDRKVERILIFYTDGSFREYTPSL
ncbi:helix-turn-helix transcriptional regulator [Spirosoma luteolum]